MKENKIIKDGYNQIGEAYHESRNKKAQSNFAYFDSLAEFLPKRGNLLDLGCGSGVPVVQYFLEKGFAATGIDISEKMIEIAKRELPKADFHCGDMVEHDFPTDYFDLITSTFAVIHIAQERQVGLFEKMNQWLKKGGRAYLVLGHEDKKSMIKEDWHGVKMYWSYFSPEKYREIFKETGFKLLWEEIGETFNGEQFYNVIIEK